MHTLFFPLAASALVFAGVPLHAEDLVFKNSGSKSTLVELYSSEGCSSCPPAEAWITGLKAAPGLWTDLFPVVFHVDYWDGLGWPDRFARPAYTQRQRNYAAQLGQDSVYTPEFVANGREWKGWFHGEQTAPTGIATRGELSLQVRDGGTSVSAHYTPASSTDAQPVAINVALLGSNIRSDVQRGENGGRQLQHDFVVLDFVSQPLAPDALHLKSSTRDAPTAVVAWVSAADSSILQVAGGWLQTPAL